MKNLLLTLVFLLLFVFVSGRARGEVLVDFEDVSIQGIGFVNGSALPQDTDPLHSGGAEFENHYFNGGGDLRDDFFFGWAFSNDQDVTTPGFRNQYSAFPGGGSNGLGGVAVGSNYGIAALGSRVSATDIPVEDSFLNLPSPARLRSVDIANTTYAARYIRDGLDGFSNPDFDPNAQFTDGDFYRLTVSGFDQDDAMGNVTGTVDFDLANYGGPGQADDFLLGGWTTIDLTSFGPTKSLSFSATSSQISEFSGLRFSDVPGYVAVDNLTAIPEPSTTATILVLGGLVAIRWRKRR